MPTSKLFEEKVVCSNTDKDGDTNRVRTVLTLKKEDDGKLSLEVYQGILRSSELDNNAIETLERMIAQARLEGQ